MEIKAIKAVRMYDHGFMNQPFAFGGEEGKEMFDEQIIYRSSLQNFEVKLYFNVGIDDKFGFEAETDWVKVIEALGF